MHPNVAHAQRGQAIVETVVFLPMFLLALFGIIWTVQQAVQYERVESAVRYAGLVSQQANPYVDYSFNALYTQLGKTTIPGVTCVTPLTAPLSDAAPTYVSTQVATASTPFWTPYSALPSCASAGLVGIQAGTGLNQDVILSQQQPGMTSTVAAPAALVNVLGSSVTTTEADAHFFKPVGLSVILACYPNLNTQVNWSLRYQNDVSTPTAPAALGSTITPIPLTAASSCTSTF